MDRPLRVLVLAGGPDAERAVSLRSGQAVARALAEVGHAVELRDVDPEHTAALDQPCDVVFPALHGKWGEGGGLQRMMDQRGLAYVGASAPAAELCMDKARAKAALHGRGLPTPPWEVIRGRGAIGLGPPMVVKALDEGSSLDLVLCRDAAAADAARDALRARHDRLLVERLIEGREVTVAVLGGEGGDPAPPPGVDTGPAPAQALPPIRVTPADEFYDYEAKYTRSDTVYDFDLGAPLSVTRRLKALAVRAHHLLGARHLSRVDFILDHSDRPWVLEVNTMPGFTDHSLVPMAARRAGIDMPALVDRLVRLAAK